MTSGAFKRYWRFALACLVCAGLAVWALNHTGKLKDQSDDMANGAKSDYSNWMTTVLADVKTHGAPSNFAAIRERAKAGYLEEIFQRQSAELTWRLNPSLMPVLAVTLTPEERDGKRIAELGDRVQALDENLRFRLGFEPRIRDASSIGYDFSTVGTPAGEEWRRALLRFDILSRVIEAIEEFDIGAVQSLNLNARVDQSFLRRSNGFLAREGENALLRALAIEFELKGTFQQLDALLNDLTNPMKDGMLGRGLLPARWSIRLGEDRQNAEILTLNAQLVALNISPDAPLSNESLVQVMAKYSPSAKDPKKADDPAQPEGDEFSSTPSKSESEGRNKRRER